MSPRCVAAGIDNSLMTEAIDHAVHLHRRTYPVGTERFTGSRQHHHELVAASLNIAITELDPPVNTPPRVWR